MAITEHYNEAITVIHSMFRHIFTGIEERYAKELAVIRSTTTYFYEYFSYDYLVAQYPSEPVTFTTEPLVLHWPEAISLLKAAGVDADEANDLSSAAELALGQLVKQKYDADFFVLDQYPASVRPFYTMPSPNSALLSNSFDVFIRGQEICSGAQRCHDAVR